MPLVDTQEWKTFLKAHPDAHILQTAAWGELKANYGWTARHMICGDAGAQILFRQLPLRRSIAYIPKGPVGKNWGALLEESVSLCKEERAIIFYLEPDAWETGFDTKRISGTPFSKSDISIQPRQTISISLNGEESDWLGRMKQKTRYNIRQAQKKGVTVEASNDMHTFNELMQVTGERDEFGIHAPAYYQRVYETFSKDGQCVLLIASYKSKPIAGIMAFARGHRAWYFYGASNNEERNRMPTYLLQWEAMCWAAAQGCKEYDLWGIPDETEEKLEEEFAGRFDGLWGVYRFKRGFGGRVRRTAGVYQSIINKSFYPIYKLAIKYRKSMVS